MRLAILDNRDSFIWNIVHLAHACGADVRLFDAQGRARFDTRTGALPPSDADAGIQALQAFAPDALIVGPGPGHPDAATLSFDVFRHFPSHPVLGICLGHQVLGRLHGAPIARSQELGHGRPLDIHHDGTGLFRGLPSPCRAGRYHSLCVAQAPPSLVATAHSTGGELLALADPERPHAGVQFHPESLLADCGAQLITTFCESA